MTDLRKAAEDLLEVVEAAIKAGDWKVDGACDLDSAIVRLRQALAQPEQEQPKHWSDCAVYNEPAYPNGECDCGGFDPNNKWHGLTEREHEPVAWVYNGILHEFDPSEFATSEVKPLYTAPPKREWVGLTEYQRLKFADGMHIPLKAVEKIEAELKEKNT